MTAAPQTSVKSLRAAGPVIVIILIVAAAFLGYYQIIYYPTVAPTSTTTTSTRTVITENVVVVTIPEGAQDPNTPPSQTYLPNAPTVYIGYNATVMWINNDSVPHTVTAKAGSPDPAFNSWGPISPPYNNLNPGDNVTFTFTVPGDYLYFCSYHNWMTGEIIVKPAQSNLTVSTVVSKG